MFGEQRAGEPGVTRERGLGDFSVLGGHIDVLVGGTLVGSGEIVIIEDTVGVRITDFKEED